MPRRTTSSGAAASIGRSAKRIVPVVRTMRDNLKYISHIHVAGVPSRTEIDETNELNFKFIAKAIADSGYNGFVAHEWRPAMGNDPIKSLEKCFEIMNV
mgnify:CR=1 FL=1